MRTVKILFVMAVVFCLSNLVFAYTNSFTLDFTSSDLTGWSDPANSPSSDIVSGESTPADSPPYSPTPNTAAGYNSTPWMRIGRSAGDNYGVALAIYDGTAGGSTTDPTDYTYQANVFVVTHATLRFQEGICGRWTSADGNFPFEVFHSVNTPGQPNGYGYRSGGSTTTYGLFTAETTNRWVCMKMTFHGSLVDIAIDNNLDGTFDYTQNDIALTDTAGKAGFFSVINDPGAGSVGVPSQFSYFDNFSYTYPTSVGDWELY